MLNSIRIQSELISLEALSGSQVFNAVAHRLPNYFADVKNFITNLTAEEAPRLELVDSRKVEKLLAKTNYATLRPVTVFTPVGLKVSYLEYIEALEEASAITTKLTSECLNPFNVWLAVQLSNPTALSSLRSGLDIPGFVVHDISEVQRKLGKCFSQGGVSSQYTYGQSVARNADWHACDVRINNLVTKHSSINPSEVVRLVQEVTANLDKLLLRLSEEPEIYKLSGVTLDTISKLCYTIGVEIEFFSVITYQLQAMQVAFADSCKRIETVLTI